MLEFEIKGTVKQAWLASTEYENQNISLDIGAEAIAVIKSRVADLPEHDSASFRWPFTGTVAKFISKIDVGEPFKNVWEVSQESLVHDHLSRKPASHDNVTDGVYAFVEYTMVPYLGKPPSGEHAGYAGGCTLQLLSVGLCPSANKRKKPDYGNRNFDSATKKKRMQ